MADNKVVYGISNLRIGTYEVSAQGVVTLGTPYHLPGTVNMSLDAESEQNTFYADNVAYWTGYSDNGYTGTLENALFTDEFKTQFFFFF